jgi:hypothetical protein
MPNAYNLSHRAPHTAIGQRHTDVLGLEKPTSRSPKSKPFVAGRMRGDREPLCGGVDGDCPLLFSSTVSCLHQPTTHRSPGGREAHQQIPQDDANRRRSLIQCLRLLLMLSLYLVLSLALQTHQRDQKRIRYALVYEYFQCVKRLLPLTFVHVPVMNKMVRNL